MAIKYAQHFSTRETPQNQAIPGKPMVPNSAGGYAFQVDCWKRLERFLILGNESGSYYASERTLTQENAQAVLECSSEDAHRAVDIIVAISEAGRAPKNDPAIFALAMLSKFPYALEAIPKVCRTATHLFDFIQTARHFRGRGRSFNRAIKQWYIDRPVRELSYQVVKYQQRNGMSHRDVLRLIKPAGATGDLQQIFAWITGKTEGHADYAPEIGSALEPIYAFEYAKHAGSTEEIVKLIEDHALVRECIPTQFLNDPEVWEALLEKMPFTAMLRNLAKMTSVGLIKPMAPAVAKVVGKLRDVESMKKARVHPLAILVAQKVYAQGKGEKGSLNWQPVSQIIDALDKAFYDAFEAVQPTNKRWLLALDVSGSMSSGNIAGMPGITPRVGSAALAMVTAAVEPNYHIVGFSTQKHSGRAKYSNTSWRGHEDNLLVPISISPRQRLDDVCRMTDKIEMGGTDCALPMIYALENKIPVDIFCVFTDSETWAGKIHPVQALQQYRQQMGIPAKLVVVGMVANKFSIADASDGGMLDVVGFDTAVPQILADFAVN